MRSVIFERIKRRSAIWVLVISAMALGQMAATQSAKKAASRPKPSLDLLAARVDGYWNLLLQRKRVKASEYVLPEDREKYLEIKIAQFSNPKLTSLEPSADRSEAKVVVTTRRSMPFGEMDWPVTTHWVFTESNWYLKLDPVTKPDEDAPMLSGKTKQETAKHALRKALQFSQDTLDFGMIRRGDSVSLKLKYSLEGNEGIYARISTSNPEMKVQGLRDLKLPAGESMELTVLLPTRAYEGIVRESLDLVARRENAEVAYKFYIQGFVYVPATFEPKILRLNPSNAAREKELLVRNNSMSTLKLQSFSSPSGALVLEPLPLAIPSGQQMALKLKQVREVEKPNTSERLTLQFEQPVDEVSSLVIPVVLNSTDKRDGLIMDPLSDPAIRKQVQESLRKARKK